MNDDLISRQLVMKTLCERRCGNKSKGCPSGFCTESIAVDCIPSAEPLTEEDYIELHDRFGEYVEFVVKDMISGKGERWNKTT